MKRLVEFPMLDGASVLAEVEGPERRAAPTRGFSAVEVVEKAEHTFEAALDKIRPGAAVIIAKLRDIGEAPKEVEVEFGLKLSAEAGAVIASVATEANFRVKLTWKHSDQHGRPE
jgi:Trypsin-co-occurring domain 1